MLTRNNRVLALLATFCAVLYFGTAMAAANSKILVVPFKAAGEPDHYAWLSDAIHESLMSDLQRHPEVQVMTSPMPSDASPAAALAAGKQAGADTVIFGSFQVVGDQLRINAQALDVSSGQAKASPAITGPVRSLFVIEDQLTEEMNKTLPGAAIAPPVAVAPQTPATADQMPAQSPMVFAPLDAQGSVGQGYTAADAAAQATMPAPQFIVPPPGPGYSYVPIYNAPPPQYYDNGYQPPVYYYPPEAYAYPPDYFYPGFYPGFAVIGGNIGFGFGNRDFHGRPGFDHGRGGNGFENRALGAAPPLPAHASLSNGVRALPHR